MLGARHHRFVAGTIVLLLQAFAVGASYAQDAKLVASCTAPQRVTGSGDKAPGAATATLTCELRAADAVVFKGVKVTIKGRTEPLEVEYTAFDPASKSVTALLLIQIMDAGRRAILAQMAEAVVKIAEPRDERRRLAAYSFANDLNPLAEFGVAKKDFEKQVRAVRAATLPSQLYKTSLEAIAKLAKETGDRKALIILGDGNSDDTADEHDQVVKVAKEAGVVIHALGYVGEATDLPRFQHLRRLADETGGFRREVRVAGAQKYTVNNQFVAEVLENGGSAKITLKEPPGPVTITLTADFGDARTASVDHSLTLAPPPSPPASPPVYQPSDFPQQPVVVRETTAAPKGVLDWAQENTALAVAVGVLLVIGAVGLGLLAVSSFKAQPEPETPPVQKPGPVYGWLDMLDGNASRYPLQTTNIRIGRHRDNDICLHNDSISRRHAVLHFDADNRRFVITDLGGDNGVVVNKIKQQSHELSDGDLVELGEVRLRFRANMELVG